MRPAETIKWATRNQILFGASCGELLSRAFSARNAYWRPRAAYLGLAQQGRRACAVKLTKKQQKVHFPGSELETLSSCTSVPNH